jgi:hypothetical protein
MLFRRKKKNILAYFQNILRDLKIHFPFAFGSFKQEQQQKISGLSWQSFVVVVVVS